MDLDIETLETKLQTLVSAVDTFVNGDVGLRVAISGGRTISTLAGLDRKIKSTKYVQKLVDYKKLVDAETDAAAGIIIVPGNVVRVYADPVVSNNRLYEVQDDLTLTRVDYTDIYDLNSTTNDHQNVRVVKQSFDDLIDPVRNAILTMSVRTSETKVFCQAMKGRMRLVSQVSDNAGVMMAEFYLLVGLYNGQLHVNYQVAPGSLVTLPIPNGENPGLDTPPPVLTARLVTSGSYHQIIIAPDWDDSTGILPGDPVQIEWTLEGFGHDSLY